jgi:orotidine-5'-phosphate decarboxylase
MSLQKTINYINEKYPDIFTIADAKRGDIGNTSSMYAKAFFEDLNFDSVTVAPYMGKDSVEPFLVFEDKHTIMLALTSNEGAFDFQTQNVEGKELYKVVLETSKSWKNAHNLMYVVGATKAEYFTEIRKIVPDSFLLVPGVGVQGGSLAEVCKYGMNANVGLLINSSRGIIYASNGMDFATKAREEALKLQQEMMGLYRKAGVSPMGGCLPMLLQFPILIAMFRFFPQSIELRQQSFLWAHDLSSYDSIADLPFKIPFLGDHLSVFALACTVVILIYTIMTSGNIQQEKEKQHPLVKINEIKPSIEKNLIQIAVSADFNVGPFGLQLVGLGIKVPFTVFQDFSLEKLWKELQFTLQGLAIIYDTPSLSIAGAFLREIHNGTEEYNGLLTFRLGKIEIIAIGSYIKTPNYSSLFAFGYLGIPIPLDPAFYIHGFALGFGLNRDFIMPQITEIPDFPLIKIVHQGGLKQGDSIKKIFGDLNRYLPVRENSYVIIAGIKLSLIVSNFLKHLFIVTSLISLMFLTSFLLILKLQF